MGSSAVHFMGQLSSIANGSGRISKGAFVRWAERLSSLQKGIAEMCRKIRAADLSRAKLAYHECYIGVFHETGMDVPVLVDPE